jgi:hypothetical protein
MMVNLDTHDPHSPTRVQKCASAKAHGLPAGIVPRWLRHQQQLAFTVASLFPKGGALYLTGSLLGNHHPLKVTQIRVGVCIIKNKRDTMPTITDDALWNIGATARQAVRGKPEWVASFAKMASALAVGVVADAAIEKLTDEDRQLLTKHATALATQRIADLVADIAEDLTDDYVQLSGERRVRKTG